MTNDTAAQIPKWMGSRQRAIDSERRGFSACSNRKGRRRRPFQLQPDGPAADQQCLTIPTRVPQIVPNETSPSRMANSLAAHAPTGPGYSEMYE
jgi:hypothetical protein